MDWPSLLQALLLGDNALRPQAERTYNELKQRNPGEVIVQLAHVVHALGDEALRALAAVLLRGIILREKDVWDGIDQQTQAQVRQAVLEALMSVAEESIRRKVCDIIAVLAQHGEFPQLLDVVGQLLQTAEAQSLGLYLVDRLAEYAPAVLAPALSDVAAVAAAGLSSGEPAKIVAASKAIISMCYEAVQHEGMAESFLPLLQQVVGTVGSILTPELEEFGQEVLVSLRQFADDKSRMGMTNLIRDQLVSVLIQVCGNRALDEMTCVIALDLLVHCVVSPGASPVDKDFVDGLVDMMMQLMCMVEETDDRAFASRPDNPGGFGDVDDYETEEIAGAAAVNMERIAQRLPANLVAAACIPRMGQYSQSDSWQMRRAAQFTLALIAEGCADEIFPLLDSMLPHVVNGVSDPHPRVRYATLHSLGQLITDFADEEAADEGDPTFSTKFGSLIIEKVHSILSENASFPRVLAMGLETLSRLCKQGKCAPAVAGPHAAHVFQTLLEIIRASAPVFVTEQAVTVFGPFAMLAPEPFQPFYADASQEMKAILFNEEASRSQELSVLRGMALECWVLFGHAIGKELFMNDALELLSIIGREHQNGLNFSDPFTMYMMQCCARIAGILLEDFVPYIDQFLPPLLEHVSKEVDVEVRTEEDEATQGAAQEDDGAELFEHYERGVGKMTFVVNTAAMQEKEVACRTLYQYVIDLKGHLGGYAEEIVRTVLPLLGWTSTEGVRMVASWTAPRMFEVCLQCGLQNAKPQLRDLMKETIDALMRSVVMLRLGSPDTTLELLSITVDALRESLKLCKEYKDAGFDMGLDAELVNNLFELLRDTAAQIIHRQYLEVQSQRKVVTEFEEDVLTHLSDAIGWTIKAVGADCVPIFKNTLEPFVLGMLEGAAVDAELQSFSICMLVDIVEYGGEPAMGYTPILIPHLFQILQQYPDELAQTSVYGFGVLAQYGGSHFDSTTTKALDVLKDIITSKRVQPIVRDNALSACMKFALYRSGQVDSAAIVGAVLPQYPLRADTFEAREAHHLLIGEFEASNPILFGDSMANAPHLIRIFFSLLGQTESITDDSPEVWYQELISLEDRARIAQDLIAFLQQADAEFSNQCIAFANANGVPLPRCFQ